MKTKCSGSRLGFQPLGRREVVADFDGGTITTDGGALLLREVEARTGILRQLAACFTDYRDPELIEHTAGELIAQQVFGLALGYEDLNDHDELRLDPLLAVLVGKAEHLSKGPNPRFVVTSFSADEFDARTLYEKEYCARGEMENRIKEQQLCLFADRTSAETMRANQLRLYFSSVAYTLLEALRRLGLKNTPLAQAQCGTIREKLLKIGAQIRVTVRKVWISLAEGCPYKALFQEAYQNLLAARPLWVPCRC